ncbi:DUF6082 family protein [Streptomyces abyssomicinicus]|uniref:DUF6082 family protein n=1 Tax=Streptomyces abyssomicinicus TaxID=574929 RepID=UPI001FE5C159|nr:DUF6082 family protein [Streptomyces abyssomicinicus]
MLLTLVAIPLVGLATVVISDWLLERVVRSEGGIPKAVEVAAVGDYFSGGNTVFAGLALLLVVTTLIYQLVQLRMQREELRLQRQELAASRAELRRSAAADLRSLHVQLTQMQLDDPSLAEVWNDYPDLPHTEVRQYLFANLTYAHYLLHFQWGELSESDLIPLAHNVVRSPAFRRYWELSRPSKELLPVDSTEGRFNRSLDQAVRVASTNPPAPRTNR